MIRYHAEWLLTIAEPPIRDGWLAVDRGRIVACGRAAGMKIDSRTIEKDLGNVVVMPGLVNAHTHLELSHLKNEIAPSSDFVGWIGQVMDARRAYPDRNDPVIVEGARRGIDEALRCGTALVGDISNTLVTVEPLLRSPLAALVFYELIRFNVEHPERFVEEACEQIASLPVSDRVRASLAAHAPYSVAPLVFRAIRQAVDRDPFAPTSVHLSESMEEVRFIRSGDGPWRDVLERLGVWDPRWVSPGVSPVQYLDDNGFLGPRTLAVHGVQMSAADLGRLAKKHATLVTCPRSNGHTGAGAPPLEEFFASNVRVAIGTDSLASAPDLNVFAELATIRALAPTVSAEALLDSATRQGAEALGFGAEYGTIEPGKRARLIMVDLPSGVADVEEYLVSGIQPEQIRWLDS